MPTFRLTAAEAKKLGLTATERKKRETVQLVEPKMEYAFFCYKFTIPLQTASEANGRDWRKRSKRSDTAWRAVSKSLGPYLDSVASAAAIYHGFLPGHHGSSRKMTCRPVKIRFVRIGGRKLDRSNLPVALKAVEDAVAFMMGADDGDPRWQAEWDQEPGNGPVGVRVELDCSGQ